MIKDIINSCSMSMFNEYQEAYMTELERIPRSQRCWCGWYRLDECPHCPKDRNNADKCLVCRGGGKRWIGPPSGYWGSCPDCKGTGINQLQFSREQVS